MLKIKTCDEIGHPGAKNLVVVFYLHSGCFKLPDILNSVFTCQERQVLIGLFAQVFQNHFHLIVLADHVQLLFSRFAWLLLGLVFVTRGKREARVSLK